ncbi:MAG: coenzyme F420-0:L-glutamate ligase [Jatrophihabitans sp.]
MPDTVPDGAARIEILPVVGMPEIRPDADLASLIAARADWLRDGDVVVVTSKIVSKSEGRLVSVDSDDAVARERIRQQLIDAETRRTVARRDDLRIVANRHGVVMAAAGVDESNVATDELALLPDDPDHSAATLRADLKVRLGVEVAVIVSDSLGRPWRAGIVDAALGVAGLSAVVDHRGRLDSGGRALRVTQIAIADEIASAADLVKGKLAATPVAVVRGLTFVDDGLGSAPLIHPRERDLFSLGTAEAIEVGRADAGGSNAPAGPLHADAVRVLGALPRGTAEAETLRQAYLGFLAARPDAMWRSCAAGHLTASTVIYDPARDAVLLTLHPRVGRWLQVGGHCEPGDPTIAAAAAREALEESGLTGLQLDPVPISLHVHPITCSLGIATRHFDVRFVAVAAGATDETRSDESIDLRWFRWDELPEGSVEDLATVVSAARQRARG